MEETLRKLWRCEVPPGQAGDWRVERFQIRRDPPSPCLREGSDIAVHRHRLPPPHKGTYTRLLWRGTVFMADTEDEWIAHKEPIFEAARRGGRVLINGLGLGLVTDVILQNPYARVDHVTVVELSADVIRLVGTDLKRRHGDRLTIVQADAFSWQPSKEEYWSVVWHDLWADPHPDILAPMALLEKRYRGRCDWQGSWARAYIENDLA